MNPKLKMLAAGLALALIGAVIGWAAARDSMPQDALPAAPPAERKPLYWYDPMVPAQRFDKPGKSPFMDMRLVPKYADEAGGEEAGGGVIVSPAAQQSLGVRTALVERKTIGQQIDAAGTLQLNERDVSLVQARAAGFVEKVYPRAPGELIAAGAPLADLLLPDWLAAQREFLSVKELDDAALAQAARQRLTLLGMPEALIAKVAASGQAQAHYTVTSPAAGLLAELMVRQGMTVAAGASLARVNGISMLWLEAEVPEAQAGRLAAGQAVEAQLAAFPGEVFRGKVAAILPEANGAARTLRLRVELPNPSGRLKAGMFAQVRLSGPQREVLVVPSEAVIRTGRRALAYVAEDGGRFRPVAIETGAEDGDQVEILKGLEAGQKVVASAQFLIDSEASMQGIKP